MSEQPNDATSQSKNGANGAGGNAGGADQQPEYVTKADFAAFAEALKGEVVKGINGAAKQHTAKALKDAGFTPDILKRLTALPALDADDDEPARAAGATPAKKDATPAQASGQQQQAQPSAADEKLAELMRRQDKLEKELKAEREKSQLSSRQLAEERAIGTLKQTLVAPTNRVRADLADDLIAVMKARNVFALGDDGRAIVRVGDDELDIATGVPAFLKSYSNASHYQLPPEPRGPGQKNPKPPIPVPLGNGQGQTLEQRAALAAQAQGIDLDAALSGR